MNPHLELAPAIREALDNHQPVVALESTLITHGLPYPLSVETALAMENAVRQGGAIPATIAILEGCITVGLTADQIDHLAQLPEGGVRKCSRRDLPIAIARGEYGATTVAGTMMVADMAGISVFATGGIGGVHRGHPQDISADLTELGRTPVAVVCSGAKSILDLPLTLEVLETQGVPVIGYGTDNLPAFYTYSSGLPLSMRVDNAQEAAAVIAAARDLDTTNGIVFAVPVPKEDEMPLNAAEDAIVQATKDAEAQGIHGAKVTPFVLARVAELTEGTSREANISLLVNNSLVAGQIASALASLN
ncbi:MAG: pseudouridine-5'-phosphate glycosidase [Anaerolineae bacterium]|nr:pseudouridine-5'-phosphate glycosidase [Anaerolineae bacterium]